MGYKGIFHLAVGALLFASANSRANFSGSDDFNDNSQDLAKWGAEFGYGTPTGVLTETSGRLEFTSVGTGSTYQGRSWKLNLGSYTSDWDIQLDTFVISDSGVDGGIGFGLDIIPTGNNSFYVGIEHDNFGQAPEYYSYRGMTTGMPLDEVFSSNATNEGAVRINFNATTKVITTYYDSTGPSDGYLWTEGASYGIAGSGGSTANTNWGMSDSDTFTAYAFGYSFGAAASAGQTYGDNFLAVPEPSCLVLLLAGPLLLFRRTRR